MSYFYVDLNKHIHKYVLYELCDCHVRLIQQLCLLYFANSDGIISVHEHADKLL